MQFARESVGYEVRASQDTFPHRPDPGVVDVEPLELVQLGARTEARNQCRLLLRAERGGIVRRSEEVHGHGFRRGLRSPPAWFSSAMDCSVARRCLNIGSWTCASSR